MAAHLSDHVWSLIVMMADRYRPKLGSVAVQKTGRTCMTDPENWPLWLKLMLFPPMLIGAVGAWLPTAKAPKWRAVQIGSIAYVFLFGIFFVWRSIIGYAFVAVVTFGLLVFLFLRRQNSN